MTTTTQNVLTGRGLIKRYGRVTALDNADFDLRAGEILAVIGDNGAGKSTLIKAMSGAITVDDGEVQLDGRPIRFRSPMEARDAGIETVYQTLALSPALSIADNMFLGREIRRSGIFGRWFRLTDRKAMENRSREMLSELGQMYLDNARSGLATLQKALEEGDASTVQRVAHTLRGSSSNMGAKRMASLLAKLQDVGASQIISDGPELLERLEAEFERVRPALEVECS